IPRPARTRRKPPWKIASKSSRRFTVTSANSSSSLYSLAADFQHSGTSHPTAAQVLQRHICLLQRVGLHLGSNWNDRRKPEKLLAVETCEIRHRAQDSLSPEDFVGKCRDLAHVDSGADDRTALTDSAQCLRHELPHGGEDDRRVELGRRSRTGGSRPLRPQRGGQV